MVEPGSKFKKQSIAAFGYEIPYIEAGQGDVIISLPGSAGLEMSRAKDLLAEEFRVIEFDPPGWGETPALAGVMKQRQLGLVLAEAIAELGIERFHLIGTSMGGTNAFWLAAQFPERVKSMILEAPMLFPRTQEDLVNPDGQKMIDALVAGAPPPDMSGYPGPPPHPMKPWSTTEFFREQMNRRFKMMAKSDHAYDDPTLRDFAKSLTIPTTMLMGTEDEIYKPVYAERFKEIVPSATVTFVKAATHDIQNTAPEAFVEIVSSFIK